MKLLIPKPFHNSTILPNKIFRNLLADLPDIDFSLRKKIKELNGKNNLNKFISKNWDAGSYQLNKKELASLSSNSSINKIKTILKKWHKLKNSDLDLKSSCIFYPSKCEYSFFVDGQKYLYHKYHLDSNHKIKALIALQDSKNEEQQFSYIKRFPESILKYFLIRYCLSRLIVFLHEFLFYISFKKIRLSGQPPNLPKKYQNPKIYKTYNFLKKGEMISFHNLYPHSSHNGFKKHKSPMLQLVFDKC